MTLPEIIRQCNGLEISEQRSATDKYHELVFYNKDIDQWNKIFTDILGPPVKPQGEAPTQKDLELTNDYGSIYDNQTLFKKKFDHATVIAMFWPWRDGEHTTLKLALFP